MPPHSGRACGTEWHAAMKCNPTNSDSSRASVSGNSSLNPTHATSNASALQTQLALDRTTLAWVRTTLSMASFGFGMVAFFRSIQEQSPNASTLRLYQGAVRMGTSMLLLGIVATLFAGGSHWLTLRKLRRGESPELHQWPLSITLAMFCAVIGLVGLWDLLDL